MAKLPGGFSLARYLSQSSASARVYGCGKRSIRLRQTARSLAWRTREVMSVFLHSRMIDRVSSMRIDRSMWALAAERLAIEGPGLPNDLDPAQLPCPSVAHPLFLEI